MESNARKESVNGMHVVVAQEADFAAWLHLAAEVEPLFGPMVAEPGFHRALTKNIARGTAYCIREDGGPAGTPLVGGLLFSPKPPLYTIGWLAVAQKHQRRGAARLLVEHVTALVQAPAEIVVTTFGPDSTAGQPARRFYERMGFRPAEMAPHGPEGASRQIYRRVLVEPPRN
jgi:GNAT superfamily N-acetyltransferase